jgi:hypothetical protein
MSELTAELGVLARVLAAAYGAGAADVLFARIGEDFQAITDGSEAHDSRMHDAVGDLQSRGRLLHLIVEVSKDPAQHGNAALNAALRAISQQTRWDLLDTTGLVLRLGPFVNRTNLKSALDKLFLARRVLRIAGSAGARGRSWSCQLIERQAALRGTRYVETDFRKETAEARTNPRWFAEKLSKDLFPAPAARPSFEGVAENRLIESLVAWVPSPSSVVVVVDHLGDDNLAQPVRDCVAALALAVASKKLQGVRLVLIDGPPGLDLSDYDMHTIDDVVGSVSPAHLEAFFGDAATALFPGLSEAELKPIIAAAIGPIIPMVPIGVNKNFALAVRDALEAMATV